MTIVIQENIDKVLKFFSLESEVIEIPFKNILYIPKNRKGVYVISEGSTIVYVGKGKIQKRNISHWEKAYSSINKNPRVPKGWQWLTENYTNLNIHPDRWQLTYITLNKETDRTAVEGALIKFLNPIANDEVFSDNNP